MLVLLFDIGGVLIDSSREIAEGYRRAFEAEGMKLHFSPEQILHLRGIGRYSAHLDAIRALIAVSKSGSRVDGIMGQEKAEYILDTLIENEITEEDAAAALRMSKSFHDFHESVESLPYLSLFPGVREGLAALRGRGALLGIVSNARRNRAKMLLGLLSGFHFDVTLTGDDVERKPSGDGILKAMRTLSADLRDTYYTGDSVNDVKASRQAGCRSVILLTGHATSEQMERAKPDLMFGSFAEMAGHFLAMMPSSK